MEFTDIFTLAFAVSTVGIAVYARILQNQVRSFHKEKEAEKLPQFLVEKGSLAEVKIPMDVVALSVISEELVEKYDKLQHVTPEFKRDKVYKALVNRVAPELKQRNEKWKAGLALELAVLKQKRGKYL